MTYVTIPMLCEHTGKHRITVARALKAAGVKPEKFPGVRSGRIQTPVANKFLAKHWPEVGPLPDTWTR